MKLEKENIQEILKNAEDEMYRHKLYESASARSKTIDQTRRESLCQKLN